jgi:hypothetical protein
MLKHAVAGAVLLLGLAASGAPAIAGPDDKDGANGERPSAPSAQPYDRESPATIRQEMDRPREVEQQRNADSYVRRPAPLPLPEPERPAYPERTSNSPNYNAPGQNAPGYNLPGRDCTDCPPPKHYDSIEVVKTSRDVDQSRVINTDSVVNVRPRVKEHNKLIIHENEIRNVGVIQHNHRIIEKEVRYVKRRPAYRVVEQVIVVPQPQPCGCPCTCGGGLLTPRSTGGGYAQPYGYGVPAYAPAPTQVVTQQVLVPVQVQSGYGYGYGYR